MVSALFFTHLTGYAVWLGAMVTLIVLLLGLRKQAYNADQRQMVRLIAAWIKWVNLIVLLVLGSGALLLHQLGFDHPNAPFGIRFMEQFGGLVLLLFLIVMTWNNGRLKKERADGAASSETLRHLTSQTAGLLSLFLVLGLSVVVVLSVGM